MPKIAMLEGYGSAPGRGRKVRQDRYGSLMCGELDPIVQRLGVALSEADRIGVPKTDTRYGSAKAFWDKQAGWWSSQDFLTPSTCRNLVAEGNSLLSGLNSAVAERGGQTTASSISPAAAEDLGIGASLSQVKWIVIGVAGIAALAYLTPVIGPLVKQFSKKATRRRRR